MEKTEWAENLGEYGSKLEIVYDDGLELDDTYKEYFFWNGTRYSS